MNAATVNSVGVLDKARQLRAQVEAGLLQLQSHSQELRAKTTEMKLICEGTKRAFELLTTQMRNGAPPRPAAPNAEDLLALLSPRQRQVLEQVIAGKPNKAIAYDLGLSEKTVESHRARVMQKLHAASFADLVRISIRAGIDGRGVANSAPSKSA